MQFQLKIRIQFKSRKLPFYSFESFKVAIELQRGNLSFSFVHKSIMKIPNNCGRVRRGVESEREKMGA